jgi:hypothetical protein
MEAVAGRWSFECRSFELSRSALNVIVIDRGATCHGASGLKAAGVKVDITGVILNIVGVIVVLVIIVLAYALIQDSAAHPVIIVLGIVVLGGFFWLRIRRRTGV